MDTLLQGAFLCQGRGPRESLPGHRDPKAEMGDGNIFFASVSSLSPPLDSSFFFSLDLFADKPASMLIM